MKWNVVKDFYRLNKGNNVNVSVVKSLKRNIKNVNVSVIKSLKNGGKL